MHCITSACQIFSFRKCFSCFLHKSDLYCLFCSLLINLYAYYTYSSALLDWGCAHYVQILYWKYLPIFVFLFCVSLINYISKFKKEQKRERRKKINWPTGRPGQTAQPGTHMRASSSSRVAGRTRPVFPFLLSFTFLFFSLTVGPAEHLQPSAKTPGRVRERRGEVLRENLTDFVGVCHGFFDL
jgi:hypothetical protein